MAEVAVVPRPSIEGKRLALVLTEDRVGHYPEFRDYFARVFDLDRVGLAEPGFVQAPSGLTYAFVFIGRSGEPFPSGVEVYAVVDALEPTDDDAVDSGSHTGPVTTAARKADHVVTRGILNGGRQSAGQVKALGKIFRKF